jgi:hypothetical protein
MNIFVLDYDPVRAAKLQCDKHVVKMSLESAQLLCSVFPEGKAPYKRTHYNHPCSSGARKSKKNYIWPLKHGIALCDEYTFRYGKIHKSKQVINWCSKNIRKLKFENSIKTHFELFFDKNYQIGNAVESNREYYRCEKNDIAKWQKSRRKPIWFT